MDENGSFATKDIYLAAALLTLGAELVDTIRDDPKHLRFVFEHSGDLKELENAYTNGKLEVSASKYAESIRRMKSIVHSTD